MIAVVDLPQSGTAQWNSAVSIDDIGQDANVSRVSAAWFTLCVLDEAGAEHRTNAMPFSILERTLLLLSLSGKCRKRLYTERFLGRYSPGNFSFGLCRYESMVCLFQMIGHTVQADAQRRRIVEQCDVAGEDAEGACRSVCR